MLYEIDTKLRPSGSKGPVAVRLSSFERYYDEEAWTWELQSLTRLRAVAGNQDLGARVEELARAVVVRPRDRGKTLADVADMRARMERERRARNRWDLKLAPGGLVDIEFVTQALQLVAQASSALSPNTGEAIVALAAHGVLDEQSRALLHDAWTLWSDLQQALRICVAGEFEPSEASPALLARLAQIGRAADFGALEERIATLQDAVRSVFAQLVGPVADGTGPLSR